MDFEGRVIHIRGQSLHKWIVANACGVFFRCQNDTSYSFDFFIFLADLSGISLTEFMMIREVHGFNFRCKKADMTFQTHRSSDTCQEKYGNSLFFYLLKRLKFTDDG